MKIAKEKVSKKYLVTGGLGFIGSYLVRRLVKEGHGVRVLDNEWRGNRLRLKDLENDFEFFPGDMRDFDSVCEALRGIQGVFHLAAINGTKHFYAQPQLVLEVSIKGIMNLLDGCERQGVEELLVASSSEVYQTAPVIPTDEKVPYFIPDPLNPRYSYAVGKIVTETMALNWGRSRSVKVIIFRPHNVYGPDMGFEHVIPQLIMRMHQVFEKKPSGTIRFPLRSMGKETRAFVYIDDFIDGLMNLKNKGESLNIYHIGTQEEVSIESLALEITKYFNRDIVIVPDALAYEGGPLRRCPDITKLKLLGYAPQYSLSAGLSKVIPWYTNFRYTVTGTIGACHRISDFFPSTIGSGASIVVSCCQVCGAKDLNQILFLGYLPPVNQMPLKGAFPKEESSYPALLLSCPRCQLVQLGLIVDPQILFPTQYPYTSSTTKMLRDNFAQLHQACKKRMALKSDDLIVDIGSNDGNLLSHFKDHLRVVGITPEDIGHQAISRGIPTIFSYFDDRAVEKVLQDYGQAKIVTATNVFAHMENIHAVTDNICKLLRKDGVFISESHYVISLIKKLQYDTIYHEHLRYYSLTSLKFLLQQHGLEIFDVELIPPHGGSIRVYSARSGMYPISRKVKKVLAEEKNSGNRDFYNHFREKVLNARLQLNNLLFDLKRKKKQIFGISAPSRATTLIHFSGMAEGILDCVLEVKGSHKIGRYIPGTMIPVEEETFLYKEQPDYAFILSWHIADELIVNLQKRGFKGDFIVPLPTPKIVSNRVV